MQGLPEFPPVKHVTIEGELYAEIEGERYLLKNIGGNYCMSADDLIKLIHRYAPEESQAEMIESVRNAQGEALGSSGAIQ